MEERKTSDYEPDIVEMLDDAIHEEYQKLLEEETLLKTENNIYEHKTEEKRLKQKRTNKKRSRRKKVKKVNNKEFAIVTYFFVALFLVMMGYIVYFNAVRSKEIINSPYNVRLDSMADRIVRGKILDAEGMVLAETVVAQDGTETRKYPYGEIFAHVVGYDSYGKSGLESTENFNLLTSNAFFLEKIVKEIREEKNIGDNVVTTLNATLQTTAYNALGNYKGAVVVMEASTGKVLAMVSKPTFNPNTIAANWDWLTTDSNSSLLNRATQGSYAPGSVFKLVTTLAYMRQDSSYTGYSYLCEGEHVVDEVTIHCANNRAHGQESLADALANSCNAAYADMGLDLNVKLYRETAKDLLFNSKLPNLLPYTESKFQLTKDSSTAEVMMTAIGQGKTQVSPYHMALISSAIANGGILMKPYLVDSIENYEGNTISKNLPEKYSRLMTLKEAVQLKEYMVGVVDHGTGTVLKNNTYTVAGKTGTAEYSSDKSKSHSWFTGFTNVDNPELVISVIIEGADQSGKTAVSVAKEVFDAYYY